MASTTPSTTHSQLDVDPEGDLMLLVGSQNQQSIRVSSKMLSLASAVFATLLSPRFAEGRALADIGSSTILIVPLPEDDPAAMVWICKALHFCYSSTVGGPAVAVLMATATLYDKYDLSKALCSWSHVWLEQWRTSCWINVSTPELLCISYALGYRDTFCDMSTMMIKNYTK
jgi:hypothetical protein